MSMIHLTNGDSAAESLQIALRRAGRDDPVFVLRDDLAIGPLQGIDETPQNRLNFWQRVTGLEFTSRFQTEIATLDQLTGNPEQLAIWHANSAADQLTLRRICYRLRNSPQRLNEVRLSGEDVPADDIRPRGAGRACAVGMFRPEELSAHITHIAPISVLRISRLALEWQEAKHANGETRRWRNNTFTSGTYAELDAILLDHAQLTWRPAARVVAELMVADCGLFVSDLIGLWRCRELAARGLLRLRGDASQLQGLEVRAADAHKHRMARAGR